MDLLPLKFDEYCDLVGGLEWRAFLDSLVRGKDKKRLQVFSAVVCPDISNDDFLYKTDPHGRLGLEVLLVKLCLFAELCRKAQERHDNIEQAAIALDPGKIQIYINGGNVLTPGLWNFSLKLVDIGGAAERTGKSRKAVSGEKVSSAKKDQPEYEPKIEPKIEHGVEQQEVGLEVELHSFGMILFRIMLVNSEQTASGVMRRCNDLAERLRTEKREGAPKQGQKQEQGQEHIAGLLQQMLDDTSLQQNNVFYSPEQGTGTNISNTIWYETLSLGFRLISNIPDFSFFHKSYEGGEAKNRQAIKMVLTDVEDLITKLRQELFIDPPKMDQEIHDVLKEMIADQGQWAGVAGPHVSPHVSKEKLRDGEVADETILPGSKAQAAIVEAGWFQATPNNQPDLDETIITRPHQLDDPGMMNVETVAAQRSGQTLSPESQPQSQLDYQQAAPNPSGDPAPSEQQSTDFEETLILPGRTVVGRQTGKMPPDHNHLPASGQVGSQPLEQHQGKNQGKDLEETIFVPPPGKQSPGK